jgi:3-oxoacyl-[acyl-carrier-protein] synthase III
MRAAITAVSHYAPPEVLDNDFFESHFDTSDEWIRSRTGIIQRRIARTGGTSDLIIPAAVQCLANRGMPPEAVDCILVATVTPDYVFPPTATRVQDGIHASRAWGFDISAACCGFIMALTVAARFVETGAARTVLVCGADKMTSVTNYQDRASAVLFGDAAGVALVEQSDEDSLGFIDHVAHMDGRHWRELYMPAGGSVRPASAQTIASNEHYLVQDGASVFKAASNGMVEITQELLQRNGLSVGDVRWLVPHQANRRIVDAVTKRVGLDVDKVMCNIEKYGNTSSATIPVCLSEWSANGRLERGDKVILTSFGAGFTIAAVYLRWAMPVTSLAYTAPQAVGIGLEGSLPM